MDIDLSQFDQASQLKLQKATDRAQQQLAIQEQLAEVTNICWNQCINKIKPQMDNSDAICISNCVGRFVDASKMIIESLNQKA